MSDRLPELLDAKALQAELGVTRAAAEAVMRKLPLRAVRGAAEGVRPAEGRTSQLTPSAAPIAAPRLRGQSWNLRVYSLHRRRLRPLEHGYRSDGWHLMIDKRGGRGAVFLVRAGRVERWPQMLIGCA